VDVQFQVHGLLDEVQIYQRALSAEEIRADYEAARSPAGTPPDGGTTNGAP
jgi:hypothetical protein